MIDQRKLDEIIKDLRGYFSNATQDSARNQGLAREIIVRYGPLYPQKTDMVILEGYAVAIIADDLREVTSAIALTHALNDSLVRFDYVTDFTSARGANDAKIALVSWISAASDEDICAIIALIFANPNFVDTRLKDAIQERYNQTEGTSCRMALALVLYQCGDDRELNKFIRDGYLPDFTSSAKRTYLNKEESRKIATQMLLPHILKIVLEDCGTEGKGFDVLYSLRRSSPSLPWKRKKYND